jgi:hypothetical protein
MKITSIISLIFIIPAVLINCGPKVMVPPRIDLTQHEVVGIIEFTFSNEGDLGPLVTKKFMDAIRKDQSLIRIVELGAEEEVLKAIGHDKIDQEAYKKIREKYDVNTVFIGELVVSDVRPDISLAPIFGAMEFSGEVDATLSVRMIEAVGGASIWSNSSKSTKNLGHISVFRGKFFSFSAKNPETAYGELLDDLVDRVSRDFQCTWVRK